MPPQYTLPVAMLLLLPLGTASKTAAPAVIEKFYRIRRSSEGGFQAGQLVRILGREVDHKEYQAKNWDRPELVKEPVDPAGCAEPLNARFPSSRRTPNLCRWD